jgi:hypothetical protein
MDLNFLLHKDIIIKQKSFQKLWANAQECSDIIVVYLKYRHTNKLLHELFC